ncbi:MAG: universal stress protein [Bacteroidota bacterium]
MKNTIVVPTDFSASALNAANYAADFAMAIGAEIALIHVCYFPITSEIPLPADVINQMLDDAAKNIEELKKDLAHKTGNKIRITARVRTGTITTQLDEFCKELQDVIVVMGAHVTNATERIIFGSNILSAMRSFLWPLIIVPNGIRFTGINIAGLACDLLDASATVHTDELRKLFNDFHPEVHVLHVTPKKHGMLNEEEIKGAEWMKEALKKFNPVFHYMQNENTESAIKDFSEQNNLDLLIIIPKKHGLFNRLLHKSQSKQMILNTHIPVMSIHE